MNNHIEKDDMSLLVHSWCYEILLLTNVKWGLQLKAWPISLNDGGGLNATISGTIHSPKVSISKKLLSLLTIFNRWLIELGFDAVTKNHADPKTVQQTVDGALRLIFTMSPPGPPPPAYTQLLEPEDYKDYRSRLLTRKKPAKDRVGLREEFEPIVKLLINPKQQETLIAWQVRFLILHELAHLYLGHTGRSHTHQQEFDADACAASLLSEYRQSLPGAAIHLSPVVFFLLFITISFIEDLISLINVSIEFVIANDFKAAFRPITLSYPQARHRIERLIKRQTIIAENSLVKSVGAVMDYGLIAIKDQFEHGIVDLKYFKWYCRVRAEEMMASFLAQKLSPEAKRAILPVMKFQRGWDSADLIRGPLKSILFRDNWHEPVLIRRSI
jgi:hypothetical protein